VKVVNLVHLQDYLKTQEKEITTWYKRKINYFNEKNVLLPVFSSFDIRGNGHKVSIVDSNVFPSGFNNLDSSSRKYASTQFLNYLSSISHERYILIITENHTRNTYYFSNIKTLSHILTQAGFKTFLGFIEENGDPHPRIVMDNNGTSLELERIIRNGNSIHTKSFCNGIILLNNDFSVKRPEILDNINQLVLPPISLGWFNRKKSTHFRCFTKYLKEIASFISFDPWLLDTFSTHVDNINFKEKDSLHDVAEAVDFIIDKISLKFKEYHINEKPLVFIKNNSGTYGLGIISVSSGKEIKHLNSKNRKKMILGKERSRIDSVLIQEGITSKYTVDNCPAEPVIYNVGGKVVGGFMRVNRLQDKYKNLNTRGMFFKEIIENDLTRSLILKNGEFSLYSMLTMIANLAIADECHQNIAN